MKWKMYILFLGGFFSFFFFFFLGGGGGGQCLINVLLFIFTFIAICRISFQIIFCITYFKILFQVGYFLQIISLLCILLFLVTDQMFFIFAMSFHINNVSLFFKSYPFGSELLMCPQSIVLSFFAIWLLFNCCCHAPCLGCRPVTLPPPNSQSVKVAHLVRCLVVPLVSQMLIFTGLSLLRRFCIKSTSMANKFLWIRIITIDKLSIS